MMSGCVVKNRGLGLTAAYFYGNFTFSGYDGNPGTGGRTRLTALFVFVVGMETRGQGSNTS